MKGKKMG